MKTNLLLILLFSALCGSAQTNRSSGGVTGNFTGAVPVQQFSGGEIFRFQPGLVTQLDFGNNFDLSPTSALNSRWFSIGRLNTGSQTVYGLRFQDRNKAVVFGYEDIANPNPRIQWIGTGAGLGNLEFRVASSFSSTISTLVTTMTKEGNTAFGPLPAASTTSISKVSISSTDVSNVLNSTALLMSCTNGVQNSNGLLAFASGGTKNNIAVQGVVSGNGTFEAGIYGETETIGTNRWAGYFDGPVFVSGSFINPSDLKLKDNVKSETNILEKLAQLKPVTYNYKEISELNLPTGMQHGFVAQELAKVFPELTKDISKPVFDKERKSSEFFDFKSVNYNGLISVLTAGINELNAELKLLKEEIATLKESNSTKSKLESKSENNKGFYMEQNIPNPFLDQTTIRFQLPNGANNSAIMVFDLNGNLKKSYPINKNQSEITIRSSDIGKGLFIYSLVESGQEMITKKMIVK